MTQLINYEDFEKVDIRSGKIIKVEPFPEARKPAYKITVDFGEEIGTKTTSAQVTKHYTPNDLIGRQVAGVVNFPEKRIAGFKSQFLLVGFPDENGDVCLITVDPKVPNGKKMF